MHDLRCARSHRLMTIAQTTGLSIPAFVHPSKHPADILIWIPTHLTRTPATYTSETSVLTTLVDPCDHAWANEIMHQMEVIRRFASADSPSAVSHSAIR